MHFGVYFHGHILSYNFIINAILLLETSDISAARLLRVFWGHPQGFFLSYNIVVVHLLCGDNCN